MGVPKQSVNFAGGGASQAALNELRAEVEGYTDAQIAAIDEVTTGFGTKPHARVEGFVGFDRALALWDVRTSEVINTAAETSMVDVPFSLPATWTVADNLARTRIFGTVNNNSGANRDITFRAKVPSGVVWSWAFTGLAASATDRSWVLDLDFVVVEIVPDTLALLLGQGVMTLSDPSGGAPTARLSPSAVRTFTPGTGLPLDFTVQMSAAHASYKAMMVHGSSVDLAIPA